ncbi:GGDEF domain-containing protein [Deinococcus piscis]|uniref:GGDEF domain-containing protein n=1 Tax=Deinococcus piscis TaxID=394230 RepID=A0ABQ3K1Z6_9DEIO|nr:diguanylate cyclase [Deinococcus piscis]GHF93952.1 GGDEF domain-containing protein [Deinococcus piscis]
MLRTLLLNFSLLITLAYLFSLTLRTWPLRQDLTFRAQATLTASLIAVVLLLQPAEVVPGVIIDMRPVPLVLLALVYGVPAAVVASVPMLLYRFALGGPGVLPAFLSIALILLVTAAVRRHFDSEDLPWPHLALLALVLFSPNGLPILLLPNGRELLAQLYLPLLALNVAGFLTAAVILRDRLRLVRLNALFQRQAQQDALSGLLNRRQFEEDLLHLQPGDLVMMLDIDHFKRINDTYGHAAGDQVITAIGQLLRSTLRASDPAYRYGGEEFAVILHAPQSGSSEMIAERLRSQIAQTPLLVGDEDSAVPLHITASLGGARHTASAEAQRTVALADQALYQAKQEGRNRWVIHREISSSQI